MAEERFRVLRLLEYEGTREWLEATHRTRAIKGTVDFEEGGIIREAIIGESGEILERFADRQAVPQRKELSAQEFKFMKRFGWAFSKDQSAIKYDQAGTKVLAHEGDETWIRDLKVAGE